MIELIRHMCPSLEEAAFFDTSFGFSGGSKEKTKATPHLIQSALEKWPKVNKFLLISALFFLILKHLSLVENSENQRNVPKVCQIYFERVRPSFATFGVQRVS